MLQPIRPCTFTQRTVTGAGQKTFEAGAFTPDPSVNAADVSASDVVTQIIDTLKPNYRNADELALEEYPAPPKPEIDLNNLMVTVDLRSFPFSPKDFIAAVKAQPHITSLVGLPLTFSYGPDAAIDLKPWFYLQVNAEQMTQLTGLPTSTSKTVHLYNEQSMHAILGIATPLRRPPISTFLALDFNANVLSLSDIEALEADVLAALEETSADSGPGTPTGRFSPLPADYPPGSGFDADSSDNETPKLLAASSATLQTIASDPRPRDNSSFSGSGSDLSTPSHYEGPELLQPFARYTRLGTPPKKAPARNNDCCTIS